MAGSLLTSPLLKVLRPAYVLGTGLVLGAAGLALMAYSTGAHSLILITLGNTLFAVGSAPGTTVVAGFVVSSAPEEQSGAASALSETFSEFGGALGIALLGSLATFLYRHMLAAALPAGLPATSAETALRGIGAARAAAPTFNGGAALLEAAKHAYTSAAGTALLASAGHYGSDGHPGNNDVQIPGPRRDPMCRCACQRAGRKSEIYFHGGCPIVGISHIAGGGGVMGVLVSGSAG